MTIHFDNSKPGMIEPEDALEWLADAGALDYVVPTPPEKVVP